MRPQIDSGAQSNLRPRLRHAPVRALLVGSFIFFQVAQGPRSPLHIGSTQEDYKRHERKAHNIMVKLSGGTRIRGFPQWEMQMNVLGWTRADEQGNSGSQRHRDAYDCMGGGAQRIIRAAEAAGPMN